MVDYQRLLQYPQQIGGYFRVLRGLGSFIFIFGDFLFGPKGWPRAGPGFQGLNRIENVEVDGHIFFDECPDPNPPEESCVRLHKELPCEGVDRIWNPPWSMRHLTHGSDVHLHDFAGVKPVGSSGKTLLAAPQGPPRLELGTTGGQPGIKKQNK